MRNIGDMHPRIWFFYFCIILGVTMFLAHPMVAVLSFFGALLWRRRLGLLATPSQALTGLLMMVLLTLLNPLLVRDGETILFYLQGRPVTGEALAWGGLMAVILGSTLLWCTVFSKIMTSDRLLSVFGRRFSRIGMIMTLVLRFIPLFLRQWKRVSEGQQALYGKGETFREQFFGWKQEMTVMVTWCLEQGLHLADAMISRGYGQGKKRSFYERYDWGRREKLWLLMLLLAVGTFCILCGTGSLTFTCYPQIQSRWGMFGVMGETVAGLVWVVLLFAPVIRPWRKRGF